MVVNQGGLPFCLYGIGSVLWKFGCMYRYLRVIIVGHSFQKICIFLRIIQNHFRIRPFNLSINLLVVLIIALYQTNLGGWQTKLALNATQIPASLARYKGIVWTTGMRRLVTLVERSLVFKEPLLLVGATGCGKTTVLQMVAAAAEVAIDILNCHQNSETADFLGGLRPVRHSFIGCVFFVF